MRFKTDRPQDRTAGEVFAAHCASYVFNIEHEVGSRHISLGDSAGAPDRALLPGAADRPRRRPPRHRREVHVRPGRPG